MKPREYYNTRKPFTPVPNAVYENEGGGTFKAVWWHGTADPTERIATMQNTRSGWTFTAHGIGIYEDGKIDWDYSTNGRFEQI